MSGKRSRATGERRSRSALPYLLVLAVGMVVLLPKLGAFGFWDPWEPKYAQSAREMVERGSWFVPYYRDEVRLTKPILVYWGVIAGTAVLGPGELGARIGGVLLALGSMAALLYTVSRMRGTMAGVLSALVLGTSPLFYLLARQATPDVYAFTTLGSALMFLWLATFGPDERRETHFVVSFVCLALAILAKGPVIALPIYLVPLAVVAAARLDSDPFRDPELRTRAVSAMAVGIPTALGVAVFAYGSWIFATSIDWQGYSERTRALAMARRARALELVEPPRLAELVLSAILVLSAWAAYQWLRASPRPGKPALVVSVALTLGAAAGLTLVTGHDRIASAAVLGTLACAAATVGAARHLLLHPKLAASTRALVAPVARRAAVLLGVLALVAGPWHAAILLARGHGYFSDFILKHNIGRIGDEIGNSGAADYYVGTLIFGLFPWCAFLPFAVATAVRAWDRENLERQRAELYLLVTVATIFAAFSVAVTKFPYYLAPMLLPVAALIGMSLDRILQPDGRRTARLASVLALMLYLPVMFDLLREGNMKHLLGVFTVKRAVAESMAPGPAFAVLLGIVAVGLALLALLPSRTAVGAVVLGAVLIAGHVNTSFIPRVTTHKTMKHLVETWRGERTSTEPLGLFANLKHGLHYYTNRSFRFLETEARFFEFMASDSRVFCIVERRNVDALRTRYGLLFPGRSLVVVDDSHLSHVLVAGHSSP